MFKLAGGRIAAKRVYIAIDEWILRDYYEFMLLKHLIDCLPNYIDVEKQTMSINFYTLDSLFDRGTWKNFDFGEKTELDIDDCSYLMPNNFSIDTFKELISGRYMEHPNLNQLSIGLKQIERSVMFSSIVEAFCNTTKPQNFFKCLATYSIENYDEILCKLGFIFDNLEKYRSPHPKLKWALEATKHDEYLVFKSIEL
uniref:Uncharacterized protein n=1 Tax=Acrobeloides nanus TaxID=290746 RepID=A0A914E224_9BILA